MMNRFGVRKCSEPARERERAVSAQLARVARWPRCEIDGVVGILASETADESSRAPMMEDANILLAQGSIPLDSILTSASAAWAE